MTTSNEMAPAAALCSELSERRGLPLIGSAGCYDAILAFELETPWTARLVGSRASDAALDAAIERIGREARAVRLLALEPEATAEGRVRVLWFSRGAGAFRSYERREFLVARGELASVVEGLALAGVAPDPECSAGPAARDLLVCTHGARDACCGKFGYPLYRELVARVAAQATEGSDVRIRRCSHLGGHRFAPTLLDLPSGRMFGRMNAGDAAAVLGGGEALLDRLASIYRGRCALPEAAQIVERELWLRSGRSFEDAALAWQVEDVPEGGGLWRVKIHAEGNGLPGLEANVIRADVDAVATPASCGRDPETEAPWKVVA